jgi:hypothetical protein
MDKRRETLMRKRIVEPLDRAEKSFGEYHLTHIYRKLDIHSGAADRDFHVGG